MKSKLIAVAMAASALALVSTTAVRAEDVKPSYDANPDIYKVIAENDEMRVILATWPAGTKDKIHSHPKSHASYSLSDCHRKLVKPDGTVDEKQSKAGAARIAGPIKAHYFENVGTTTCQSLLVELK
jgi:hypothetical protein